MEAHVLRVFQNFQDKPNFSRVFQKVFPQLPCLLSLLEKTTDRKVKLLFLVLRCPVRCTDLELLPDPLQNKICYRLHPKCTPFSCFPIVCSPPLWKSLCFKNRNYLRHFWYFEGNWPNVISTFCRQLLLLADCSVVHSRKV